MSSRKSYRNKMVRKDALRVTYLTPGGEPVNGELLDVHGEGAAIRIPAGAAIRRGDGGTLQFSSGTEAPFELPVEVRSIREVADGIRVGFVFRESSRAIQWPTPLRSLFNRRGAYRVRPRSEEELRVLIQADSEDVGEANTARGVLADISLTGARIRLDEPLGWGDPPLRVRVSFSLPGSRLRVMIGAVLRNTYADALHVGLEFESDGSRRFGINQKEIREYIIQRQREDLRRMSWLNE